RSKIGPKPVNGRVPLLIGGTTKPAVERAARLGDGFAAVLVDWETMHAQMSWYHGAGGDGLVVLRVNPDRVDVVEPGAPFTGPISSVVDDLARAGRAGVDVVVWDLNMAGLDSGRQVAILEALSSEIGRPAGR